MTTKLNFAYRRLHGLTPVPPFARFPRWRGNQFETPALSSWRRFLMLLFLTGGNALTSPGAEPIVFPAVEGRDLKMNARALPNAFDGKRNLVLVAFQRWQQSEVDTWIEPAGRIAARDPGFRFFEVPALGAGYSWMRGFIDGGMRRGVPDPAARARTITLYLDKVPFRRALAIADETHITALLLDERGRVIWRTTGPADDPKIRELEKALRRQSPLSNP